MNSVDKARVTELVFAAVDEVNAQLPRAKRLDKSPDTVLTGEGARLDSLGLVNLLFNTEQQLEVALGVSVTLAEDGAAAAGEQFRTLGSYTDFVHALIAQKQNG